ncbi:unnamed protein product [Phytophthora lilii]|uniref:Unnamed protein product n=1 Tax=Phytophthora lilii TaxID=2077276 RepID=A0A9W6TWZ1_9STRA|nr:unnamed protein product [Phytophthora lilii]
MAGGSVFQVGEDIEFYKVVVLLSALATCLLVFEGALHHLEHHLERHDKYQHMLKKVYRELMILGLLSFIIKMLTEVGGIDGYSGTMLAFQVADLIIFILAIVLVIQAIWVLLLLRGHNKRADRAELVTTQDLVDVLKALNSTRSNWCCGGKVPHHDLLKKECKDKSVLAVILNSVAQEEASAWQNEAADTALDAMNKIHAEHEDFEHERKAARRGLLKGDAGLQLVATCLRNVPRVCCCRKRLTRRPTGVQPESPDINLLYFSRKAWHVVVMFITILNGFFVALLVQGAVYSFDEIYDQVGVIPVIMIPLPLMLNEIFLQKSIFRDFVLICSIIRLDASTLGETVNHFSEMVELRSEFATSLLRCLKEGGLTIGDLEKTLQSRDLRKSGLIEISKLRAVLVSFGFYLTRFRFNSVIKLLFELQGTKVEYAQLIQLVTLIQQEHSLESGHWSRFSELLYNDVV